MEHQTLITTISNEMDLALPENTSFEEMREQLRSAISVLIAGDFQQLIYVLYRVDVNERKLKYLLQENVGEDAAVIITDLIIERQLEKIKSRREFTRQDDDIDEEDKW